MYANLSSYYISDCIICYTTLARCSNRADRPPLLRANTIKFIDKTLALQNLTPQTDPQNYFKKLYCNCIVTRGWGIL